MCGAEQTDLNINVFGSTVQRQITATISEGGAAMPPFIRAPVQ